jgi:hypothetical protein
MRNESADPDPESAFFLGITYSIYALIGIPPNLFVVIATLASESLRKLDINIFVLTLALGDALYLLSATSSMFWSLTYDIRVCKIGGIGFYNFVTLSVITPPCLAISRYAVVCSGDWLGQKLQFLTKRSSILIVNVLLWTYVIVFPIPFIAADKFGLDVIGVCGIESFDSNLLLIYFIIGLMVVLFLSYAATFVFYRKLDLWIRETSAGMSRNSSVTKETIEGEHFDIYQ